MPERLSLGNYLLLVDYIGRLFREGKTAISREVAGILERLGTTAETWQARLEKLRSPFLRPLLRDESPATAPGRPAPGTDTRAQSVRMPGDLTMAPGTKRDQMLVSGGDSLRRLREPRPGTVGVTAKPEKLPHAPAIWDDWVVP